MHKYVLPELSSITNGSKDEYTGIFTGLDLAGRFVTLTSTVSISWTPVLFVMPGSLKQQIHLSINHKVLITIK